MGKKYIPDYKIGEYITGIDRSFPRSIYKYLGHNRSKLHTGGLVSFQLIMFENRRGNGIPEYFPFKMAKEYRVATRKELIESGVISKSIDFILED